MRKEIERLENELKMISYNLTKGEQLESVLTSTFKEIEDRLGRAARRLMLFPA